jgi:hypothetical protein
MYSQYNNLYHQIPYMDYNNLVQTLTIPLTPDLRAIILDRLVQMNNQLLSQMKIAQGVQMEKSNPHPRTKSPPIEIIDLDQELKYLSNLEKKITKPKEENFNLDKELQFLTKLNEKIAHDQRREEIDIDQELRDLNNLKQKILNDRKRRKSRTQI